MLRHAFIVTSLAALFATACIDKLSAPDCAPVAFSPASMSGDTVTTTTGLRYIDGTAGLGSTVDWCHAVSMHYDAFLLDGTKFDSSRDGGTPLVFTPGIGGLIDGVEQGVIGMRAGGSRRLIIPPALGFGPQNRTDSDGRVVVPGNSTLVYDIQIVEVGR